jgi:hypothetical protein
MMGDMIEASPVPCRVAIDIWRPYLVEAIHKHSSSVIYLHADVTKFSEMLLPGSVDLVIMTDFLEHLHSDDAHAILWKAFEAARKRVFCFVPIGIHEQDEDPTGMGADDAQTHKSFWEVDTLRDHFGFDVGVWERFWVPRSDRRVDGTAAFCFKETG